MTIGTSTTPPMSPPPSSRSKRQEPATGVKQKRDPSPETPFVQLKRKRSPSRETELPSCPPSSSPPVKQKRGQGEEVERQEAKERARTLEKALLAAAPSAESIMDIIQGEYCMQTLANAVARMAATANKEKCTRRCDSLCECLRSQRVAKLWPSVKERLEKQMRFSASDKENHSEGRLKLEVQMVPEEAPRAWLSEYSANGQIKQLVADTKSMLKFIANEPLGFGYIFDGVENTELTFAYDKVSKKLLITGKHEGKH